VRLVTYLLQTKERQQISQETDIRFGNYNPYNFDTSQASSLPAGVMLNLTSALAHCSLICYQFPEA